MFGRLLITLLALPIAVGVSAQDKKRIEKAADLPVFSYKVDGKLEALVRDDAKFNAFARELRRDIDSVLATYDISDKAKLREFLSVLVRLDLLEGRYDDALVGALKIRELEEKPADKLLSGLLVRAIVEARRVVGNTTSDAYRREVSRLITADLAGMPYDVIQNEIKEAKAGAEIMSEALALGYVNNVLQPTVDKAGSLSSDLAPIIVGVQIPPGVRAAAQGNADRDVHALSRRAQGREAGHLGRAQRRACAGQGLCPRHGRRVGQRRRFRAVQGSHRRRMQRASRR